MVNVMTGPDPSQSLRGDRFWAVGVQLWLDQFDPKNASADGPKLTFEQITKAYGELITGRFQAWLAGKLGIAAPTYNDYEARRYLSQAMEMHCGRMVPRTRAGWERSLPIVAGWIVDTLNKYVRVTDLVMLIEDPTGSRIPGVWRYEKTITQGILDVWELHKAQKIGSDNEIVVEAIGGTQREARSVAVLLYYIDSEWID
ncbi:hypothetical protein HGA91_03110 [candidate division WWE3 bacterium]|nr:hypothetical protein [candidate division WWE3 bacterium]